MRGQPRVAVQIQQCQAEDSHDGGARRAEHKMGFVIDELNSLTKDAIYNLDKPSSTNPDYIMLRNYASRGMVCLDSIRRLWKEYRCHDCDVLFRSLVDLVVHLKYTYENKKQKGFEYWTRKQKHDISSKALNNEQIRKAMPPELIEEAKSNMRKFRALEEISDDEKWSKPKAKDVLRGDFEELYLIGYHFPSTNMVHPVADTGILDFFALQGRGVDSTVRDGLVVMGNAYVAHSCLLMVALESAIAIDSRNSGWCARLLQQLKQLLEFHNGSTAVRTSLVL